MEDFFQPDINVKEFFAVGRENQLKSSDGFPYAGMWIFSGQQGSGKTLLMMHCLKDIIIKISCCRM